MLSTEKYFPLARVCWWCVGVRGLAGDHNTNQCWTHRESGDTDQVSSPVMLTTSLSLLSIILLATAQRGRNFEEEDQYGRNSVRQNSDVGEFPFQRGERPIFNFDQGDEVSRTRS